MSNRVKAKIHKKKRFRCPACKFKECSTKIFTDGHKEYVCNRCQNVWRER